MSLENGSKAVQSFVEAMKSQPLSLALVVMNFCLLGFLYYSAVVATNERRHELDLLYENRREVGQLLANCYPSPPPERR